MSRSKVLFGCLRNRLEMRRFLVFAYLGEAGLASSWAAGFAREGKDEGRMKERVAPL